MFLLWVATLVLAGFAGAVIGKHFDQATPPRTTTTSTTARTTTTSTVPRSSVKVLVANGTSENNAAAHFTQQLQSQGWSTVTPTNATSSASATGVYYMPGQQAPATAIASSLGVATSAVQPFTASVPVPPTPGVNVVVVIGPDLAGHGFPATTTTPAT